MSICKRKEKVMAQKKRANRGKSAHAHGLIVAGIYVPDKWWRYIPAALGVIAAIWIITVGG